MKETKVEIVKYEAVDGKMFDSKYDCKEYEKYLELNIERFAYLSKKFTSIFQSLNDDTEDINVNVVSDTELTFYIFDKPVNELYNIMTSKDFVEKFLNVIYIKHGYKSDSKYVYTLFSTR